LWALLTRDALLRSITRESLVVLVVAVVLSTLAGLALEHQLMALTIAPALLVMVPAFVSSAGAVGGILASRSATLLHLGTVAPTLVPERPVRREVRQLLAIALPVQGLNALGAFVVASNLDDGGGSIAALLAVALIAGTLVSGVVVFVAYGASVAAYRFGLDPDTYGIPVVTSTVDFIGVLLLLVTASALGVI
jgi:mgtE-like transporter